MRTYPAIDVLCPAPPDDDVVDRLLAVVDDQRPTAVEVRDLVVRIFFSSPRDRERAIEGIGAFDARLVCTPIDVPGDDWAERSQQFVTAIRAGALTIAPPWDLPDDRAGVIVIQPSMGFGTGHHASTRLCLRLLQQIDLAGASVVDVGTGSGVLAIAAWKLGATEVVAIDVDEDALTAARENVERNGAGNVIALIQADLDSARLETQYDAVLANLTGGVLIRCAHQLVAMMRPGGRLVASGITSDESDDVIAALTAAGALELLRETETGWVGLMLTSPTASTAR